MGQQTQAYLQSAIPFILLIVVFYFLIYRPQQKRQKEHQQLISNLKPNETVVTIGGLYGKVVKIKESSIMLRIAEKVDVEFEMSAIAKKIT